MNSITDHVKLQNSKIDVGIVSVLFLHIHSCQEYRTRSTVQLMRHYDTDTNTTEWVAVYS
jgi:hypothetical protein